jgi:uncharacterized protein VirK/YbjX
LIDLLHADPAIALKCTRSYLWTGLNGSRRLLAQLSFFEWLLSQYSSRQITHFYKVNHTPLCHFAIKEHSLEVQLKPSRGLGREGEISSTKNETLSWQQFLSASDPSISTDLNGIFLAEEIFDAKNSAYFFSSIPLNDFRS